MRELEASAEVHQHALALEATTVACSVFSKASLQEWEQERDTMGLLELGC